jgi:hypothetical protein
MSVTVIQSPPAYALIEHGLLCRVQSNKSWQQATISHLRLILPNDQQLYFYKQFVLVIGGIDYTFKFHSSPDDTGYELRFPPVDFATFLSQLVEDLNKCYFIYEHFEGTVYDTTGILLTAREPGAAYDIHLGATDIVGITWSQFNGLDEVSPMGYRILLALAHEGELVAQSLAPIDNDGIAVCDFASLVRDMLAVGFTYPVNTLKVVLHTNSTRSFQLVVAEYYNLATKVLNFDTSFLACYGGLKQADIDLLALSGADYFGYMDMKSRFLNWCPDGKQTAWGVPERLYFLNYTKSVVYVKAIIYSTTGLNVEVTLATISTSDLYIEILCGLHEIDPGFTYANVTHYEVFCETELEAITETRTFVFVQDEPYAQRVILFKNSFSVYETLRCTGDMAVIDNITKDIIEAIDRQVYRKKIRKSENNAKFSLYSGWLKGVKQRRWLEDLLLSKEVYWLQGELAVPIVLLGGEIERETDKDYNYGVKLDFTLDVTDERYSNLVTE